MRGGPQIGYRQKRAQGVPAVHDVAPARSGPQTPHSPSKDASKNGDAHKVIAAGIDSDAPRDEHEGEAKEAYDIG